ncbi:universal stress protein [Pseudonocardia sp. N23]|uniref:universal stress protein n=1 Tax=Pseudonocardia sp. N23 TaxID=1987376 RepID=UPI000BFD3E2F|nr:universal stress protein [Pseudonocardia sp. N23]GAY07347.1 universal stress protein family [Pseudonocardia sp. N23]
MSRHRSGPVVVGVDGSRSASQAVEWGATEAMLTGAPLRLVAALGPPAVRRTDDGDLQEVSARHLVVSARAALDMAADQAVRAQPCLDVDSDAREGFPVPVLLDESRHATVLVIGNRGLGGVPGLLLGSVSTTVAAKAECPVVVVRGTVVGPGDDRPVVVGVDGSPISDSAIELAFAEASERGAPLLAVHAWSDRMLVELGPIVDMDAINADERQLLSQRLAGRREEYPDVEVRTLVRRDKAAEVLLDLSAKAQLVVVGSRGRGRVSGLLLGSVGHALLHLAECPVLVARS